MRNHVAPATASRRPIAPADAAMRWVGLALGLSILVLALRIASIW